MTLAVGEAQRAFPASPVAPVADAPASTAGHAERDALHARFADRLGGGLGGARVRGIS